MAKSFSDMVKTQRNKNIKKDADEEEILQYRQVNIRAFKIMIDALQDASEIIQNADRRALELLNSRIKGHGGYYGMFLLGGSEADLDGILDMIDNAIAYCERAQIEYANGEWDD